MSKSILKPEVISAISCIRALRATCKPGKRDGSTYNNDDTFVATMCDNLLAYVDGGTSAKGEPVPSMVQRIEKSRAGHAEAVAKKAAEKPVAPVAPVAPVTQAAPDVQAALAKLTPEGLAALVALLGIGAPAAPVAPAAAPKGRNRSSVK